MGPGSKGEDKAAPQNDTSLSEMSSSLHTGVMTPTEVLGIGRLQLLICCLGL